MEGREKGLGEEMHIYGGLVAVGSRPRKRKTRSKVAKNDMNSLGLASVKSSGAFCSEEKDYGR